MFELVIQLSSVAQCSFEFSKAYLWHTTMATQLLSICWSSGKLFVNTMPDLTNHGFEFQTSHKASMLIIQPLRQSM